MAVFARQQGQEQLSPTFAGSLWDRQKHKVLKLMVLLGQQQFARCRETSRKRPVQKKPNNLKIHKLSLLPTPQQIFTLRFIRCHRNPSDLSLPHASGVNSRQIPFKATNSRLEQQAQFFFLLDHHRANKAAAAPISCLVSTAPLTAVIDEFVYKTYLLGPKLKFSEAYRK